MFNFTAEEAQPAALAVRLYLTRRKLRVSVENSAWQDSPLRTTLVAIGSGLTILVEAQGSLNYSGSMRAMASWLAARRYYAQFYIATPASALAETGMIEIMKTDGVGLFIVNENGKVNETIKARNAALVVTPDPTLKLGRIKTEVEAAIRKFNDGERKDGLRDMCEIVERETNTLAILASKKKILIMDINIIQKMDWSTQINTLASIAAHKPGLVPLLDDKLKVDIQSFRGARNLVDHRVQSKAEEKNRQKQFAERMMQGPRLASELLSIQRKVK